MSALRLAATLGGVLFSCGRAADGGTWARALLLSREADVARRAGDTDGWIAKATEAAELRPDNPEFHAQRAAALAAADRAEDAVAALRRIAAAGLHPSGALTEFPAALRARKDYQDVAKVLTANLLPRGGGEVGFSLRDVTGAIEAMAADPATGELYFGDGVRRAVWMRAKDGALRRFSAETDDLLGVTGLAWDERRGAVWAATAALPGMAGSDGATAGRSNLVELDAATGGVRRVWAFAPTENETHELRGVAVAPDGAVWVADRAARCLWRLRDAGGKPERAASDAEWLAPRGVTVLADGTVIVGDETSGLHRVDPANGNTGAIELPANGSLTGLTGLTGDGESVYVLQGETRPTRVLRATLEPGGAAVSRLTVLEAGHLAMSAPAAVCWSVRGELFFVGNAGWGRVQSGPSAPRPVPVFRTKLPGAGR